MLQHRLRKVAPPIFYEPWGFFFNCERVLKMLIQRDVFFLYFTIAAAIYTYILGALMVFCCLIGIIPPFELLWP